MNKLPPSIGLLQDLLAYDANTGLFTWKASRGNMKQGEVAGSNTMDGYKKVTFVGRTLLLHRIAFAFSTGRWPVDQIDHINGKRDDNRSANLREANASSNSQNKLAPCGATLLKTGVWRAQVTLNRKQKHLGFFATKEEARSAYLAAKFEMHPLVRGRDL